MGETGETLEPQDKRRQSAILHKVLALQARERDAEANGLAGFHGEEKKRASSDLAQVEQLLEDKYLPMKFVKGWEEEEDDYALFASPAKKKGQKKQFKG